MAFAGFIFGKSSLADGLKDLKVVREQLEMDGMLPPEKSLADRDLPHTHVEDVIKKSRDEAALEELIHDRLSLSNTSQGATNV